ARVRAERAERLLLDAAQPDRDPRAPVVPQAEERAREPERSAQAARQERDAHDSGSPKRPKRSPRVRALEHAPLELEAVDEERSDERLEARHAERVPDARADNSQIRLAGAHVGDDPALEVDLASIVRRAPVPENPDPDRPS